MIFKVLNIKPVYIITMEHKALYSVNTGELVTMYFINIVAGNCLVYVLLEGFSKALSEFILSYL